MKKPNKKKMYNKRRRKSRQEKRKNAAENKQIANDDNNNIKRNCKFLRHNLGNQQIPLRHGHQRALHHISQAYTDNLKNWWLNYQSTIRYHVEQQREWLETLQQETDDDDNENAAEGNELLDRYAALYETSSSEDDNEEDEEEYFVDNVNNAQHALNEENVQLHVAKSAAEQMQEVDMEYLKFIEITHKHREDLRLQREIEGN